MDDEGKKPRFWSRLNWWKVGFFIFLFLFEFTREIAVIESDPPAKVAATAFVSSNQGYTMATGRWVRIDGGDKMVPSATSITCVEEKGTCVEATSHIMDGYLNVPQVDTFDATFAPDAVSYENDQPSCARYSVRIDLKLEKVLAVRVRKNNPSNDMCAKLEPRIEMTLGDGYQRAEKPLGDHFVPIISTLAWIFDR